MENTPAWIKAKSSTVDGQCVELAQIDEGIAVRNSRHPEGPVLIYTKAEFQAFLQGAQNGEFNHLI